MSYQRHPVEVGPLVFGLVFLGIVVAWVLFEVGVVTGADAAWILPIVLIGAGGLGVVLAATRPRRTSTASYAGLGPIEPWPARTDTYAGAEPYTTTDPHTDPYTDPYTETEPYTPAEAETDPPSDSDTHSRERHHD
jgi:hypothetical protein